MLYICETCKYSSQKKSNFDKHLLTNKHLTLMSYVNGSKNGLLQKACRSSGKIQKVATFDKYICKFCQNAYSTSRSMSKHMKACQIRTSILDKYDDLKEKYDLVVSDKERLEEKCEELYSKYNESRDDLIVNLKRYKPNPNLYTFVDGNFLDTLPLEKIKPDEVPQLEFLKKILKMKDGDLELCEVSQHHILHETSDEFVGKFLVKKYQNKDKSKQQFFNTDYSRLTYLVRDLVNGVPTWRIDKKGVIVSDKVIDPILEFLRDHLSDFSQKYLNMSMKKYEHKEFIERNHRLLKMITNIDNGTTRKKILQYIASFFRHDKDPLKKPTTKMIKEKKKKRNKGIKKSVKKNIKKQPKSKAKTKSTKKSKKKLQ